MPELPEDFKTYLSYMKGLSTYIVAWEEGDKDASPESIAGMVWLGTAGNSTSRAKLTGLVEKGYDAIIQDPQLTSVIKGLDAFPNFTQEQLRVFVAAATVAEIIDDKELDAMVEVTDLAPAVDEFRNHITIQSSPKGREWFCRLLNSIALKANKPAPHAEFLPGGQAARRGGADNL